jgi:alginate biosynthesis protein Alg44
MSLTKKWVDKGMSTNEQQIVHESEAQRQFVRIQMPAKAELNGASYAVRDLSSGGIGLLDVDGAYKKGQTVDLTLTLPFGDFELDVRLEGQVQNHDAKTRILGCRFTNLTTRQVSLLNHVLKSFIAGDVVASGDILNVVSRDNFVRVRNQKGGAAANDGKNLIARQIIPMAIIGVLALLALFVIGGNVFESTALVKSSDAVVTTDVVTVRATADGAVKILLAPDVMTIDRGAPLLSVAGSAAVGTTLPTAGATQIVSPCDCFVARRYVEDGGFVTAGTPVVALIPKDAQAWVSVTMSMGAIQNLSVDDRATVKISGTKLEVSGRVAQIESNTGPFAAAVTGASSGQPMVAGAVVKVKLDQKVPVDMIGRPAQVVFQLY